MIIKGPGRAGPEQLVVTSQNEENRVPVFRVARLG